MTKVKICGLSEIEHAIAASEAGADFVGLVFAPSRRQVSLEKGRQLAEAIRGGKPHPEIVGVFVNATTEEVNRIADYCRLDWVQLNGDESWQYCQQVGRPVIKAIHIAEGQEAENIIAEIEDGYQLLGKERLICLLDTYSDDLYGGTGQVFNWRLAAEISARFPVMIAGGLTPENVARLVTEVQPWGVDVSSGVETNGRKDIAKIKDFIRAVKGVTAGLSRQEGR